MGYQLNKSKHSLALCLPLISRSLYHHLAAVCLPPFRARQRAKRDIGVVPSIIGFQGLIKIKFDNVYNGNKHRTLSLTLHWNTSLICLQSETVLTLSTSKPSSCWRLPMCIQCFYVLLQSFCWLLGGYILVHSCIPNDTLYTYTLCTMHSSL